MLIELAGQLGWSMSDFWDATYFELCCAYDGLCRWHGAGAFARRAPKVGGPWTKDEIRRARSDIERARRDRDRLPRPAIPEQWLAKMRRVNARRTAARRVAPGGD